MTIEERIGFTVYKVNTQFSVVPNKDRMKVFRLFKGREQERVANPSHLVEVYNELKDYRLSAYVCGVTVLAVKQAVAGDLFPKDMMFLTSYIAEASGRTRGSVYSAKRVEIVGRNPNNRLCTKKEAYKILSRVLGLEGRLGPEDGVVDRRYAADALGTTTATVTRALDIVGIKHTLRGTSFLYDKEKVDILVNGVFSCSKKKLVSYAADVYEVKEYRDSNMPGSFMLSSKGKQTRLLARKYKEIVDASYRKEMTWTEFGVSISTNMEEEYKKIVLEIQKKGK